MNNCMAGKHRSRVIRSKSVASIWLEAKCGPDRSRPNKQKMEQSSLELKVKKQKRMAVMSADEVDISLYISADKSEEMVVIAVSAVDPPWVGGITKLMNKARAEKRLLSLRN